MSEIQHEFESDDGWETEILDTLLSGVLAPDGTIDFDALRATGNVTSLDDFYDLNKDRDDENTEA